MNVTKASMDYALACKEIIDSYREDFRHACVLIENLQTPSRLHPMLVKIADLAPDIHANYRGEDDDRYHWKVICDGVDRFIALDWEPTAWCLIAIYGRYKGDLLRHSFSLAVYCQGGVTTFETGNDGLLEMIKKLNDTIRSRQTDEWHIRNLECLLPDAVGELKLTNTNVSEVPKADWDRHG